MVIAALTLSYAVGKFIELINRKNPIITENVLPDFYNQDNQLDITQTGFRVAVATF